VSGCRSHGELLGPYVLGALEPDETNDLRRHLEACASCAEQERALRRLPALLDLVEADAPVASPPPELEDAVLDRFVRERARAAPPPRRRRWLAIPAIATACVIAALAIAVLPGGSERAYARAELQGGDAWGTARVGEVDAGTRVELRAAGLPMRRGAVYELWCVRNDGRWVSGGSFRGRADGTAAAELTAAVRPGEYHLVVVTRRSAGGERGAEIMRGELQY
jgi:Anti-sigma-K factor rskA/Putative zinc-finger